MGEHETALATNRDGWNHVAKYFHGSTALPEYGPLTPTEDTLRLLDDPADACVLELGCGSGHSLRYLADRGARELWGLDLSSTQIAFAEETLRPFASRVRLIESPMEVNPGIPQNHFDLVFSIYGLGWTTDLPGTMGLVNAYLRPGGSFIVSGEHPAYGCLEWNGAQYTTQSHARTSRKARPSTRHGKAYRSSSSITRSPPSLASWSVRDCISKLWWKRRSIQLR
jgi:SAM-dependent methyltransferase